LFPNCTETKTFSHNIILRLTYISYIFSTVTSHENIIRCVEPANPKAISFALSAITSYRPMDEWKQKIRERRDKHPIWLWYDRDLA